MSDLISRQAAIKAIEDLQDCYNGFSDTYDKACIIGVLEEVPSAQPEIVRCKDCRWGKEVCGNIECFADTNVPPEYHGYDWFCPNGERRTDE